MSVARIAGLAERGFGWGGRMRRSRFWFRVLYVCWAGAVARAGTVQTVSQVWVWLAYPGFAVLAGWLLSALVRRLHDTGRPGDWVLIVVIPLVGPLWLFLLLCSPGERGDNRYGPGVHNAPA